MIRQFSRWVGAAVLCATAFVGTAAESTRIPKSDPRIPKLEAFFHSYDCPIPYRANTYVRAADEYHLDYRVLPALSIRESTCGMYQRSNNHWGWDSGRSGFKSVEAGIKFIARQLGEGRSYRGKSLDAKLRTYNPVPGYVRSIRKLMDEVERTSISQGF